MTTTDVIEAFPEAMRLLERTAEILDDPDADVIEAYQLESAIRDLLNRIKSKTGGR